MRRLFHLVLLIELYHLAFTSTDSECQVPQLPNGGERYLDSTEVQLNATLTSLPANTNLTLECKRNHWILEGDSIIRCYTNGSWSDSPQCVKMCPPPPETTVNVECKLNGQVVDCEGPQRDGTTFKAQCRPKHVNIKNPLNRCELDRWKYNAMPFCRGECGQLSSSREGVFPWHGLVYQSNTDGDAYEYICGATLINDRFLISAAHCFYNDREEKARDAGQFVVEMGKLSREQGEDNQYVLSELAVEEIILPKMYGGYKLNLQNDIALVKLENRIELNDYVLPICFNDKDHPAYKTFVSCGTATAKVTGRVLDENKNPTEKLKYLDVPVIDYEECRKKIGEQYLTSDKICSGYMNGSYVCQGDGGGGLVYESDNFSQESRWYMLGIVGITSTNNTCKTDSYIPFTNIENHIDWVRIKLRSHGYFL